MYNDDNPKVPLHQSPLARWIAGGVLGFSLIIYFLAGLTHVNPGEAGILVKNIGDDRGMQREVLTIGLHWIEPFAYDVVTYDTRWHQADELKEVPSATADGQPVLVDISLQIGLDPALVPQLHQQIGTHWYEQVVYPRLRALIRNKVPTKTSAEIYTNAGREAVQQAINDGLETEVKKFGILTEVNLREIAFTNKAYVSILEQKATAEQQVLIETRRAEAAAQTAINVANVAEGRKQSTIKDAEARREQARLEGEGDRLKNEETAKGNLALLLAEAQGTAAKRNALEGAGGDRLVSIAWAQNLGPNVKVWGVPTGAPGTSTIVDLNGILKGAFKGD